MLAIIILAAIVAVYFILKQFDTKKEKAEPQNNKSDAVPAKLLDLDTTTLADRQRAYKRGYRTQMRYDILQRQAELAGDTAILEAIRTNTYNGPLPELDDEALTNKPKQKTITPKVQGLKFFCIKDKGYHVSVWPKDVYIPDYIEFDIAGISYHKEAAMQRLGETLGFLAEEPDNPYDSNAIRIMTPDWQCVGYVPKDMTAQIREQTKLPCPCFFYIGVRSEDGDQIFYTDAYIKLDLTNPKTSE